MRRLTAIVTLTLTILFLSSQIFATGLDLTGVGARAQALGGNYRAVSDDWSAMHWNPAGMAFTQGFTAGFSSELIKVNVGYTPAQIAGMQFSTINTSETNNEPKTFFVPSGGLYYSDGKKAFGLGIWAPFGLGAKWDVMNTMDYNSNYPEFDYDDDLMVINIQPTFAYKLNDKLSLGLGVGFVMADIMIQKPNFTPNPYIFNETLNATVTGNAILYNGLNNAGAFNPAYNHLITDTNLNGSGFGYSINAGLMFKPSETLSIGASVQYYSTITLDGTVDATAYFADNEAVHTIVDYWIAPQIAQDPSLSATEKLVISNFYSGGSIAKANENDVTAEMPLPLKLGLGISWTGIPNLLLCADVALTQWSVWDRIEIKDEDGNLFSELVEEWENTIRFGLGGEYNFGMLVARGAWYTEPNAAVDETMTLSIPDFNKRNVLMGGIGLPLGPVTLHASYEKIMVGDKEVSDWNYDAASSGYHNLAGSFNMNIDIIMFGLDYNF